MLWTIILWLLGIFAGFATFIFAVAVFLDLKDRLKEGREAKREVTALGIKVDNLVYYLDNQTDIHATLQEYKDLGGTNPVSWDKAEKCVCINLTCYTLDQYGRRPETFISKLPLKAFRETYINPLYKDKYLGCKKASKGKCK